MEEIIFVTHNKGKIASAKERLKEVNFKIFEYELEEPRSDDIKYISKYKVMEAYRLVNRPCISLDCGFWIDELNGSGTGQACDHDQLVAWYIDINVFQVVYLCSFYG